MKRRIKCGNSDDSLVVPTTPCEPVDGSSADTLHKIPMFLQVGVPYGDRIPYFGIDDSIGESYIVVVVVVTVAVFVYSNVETEFKRCIAMKSSQTCSDEIRPGFR